MPEVRVVQQIRASIDDVWAVVSDIEAFSGFMDDVQSVEVLRDHGHERVSSWSVLLEGSVLEWTEHERIDRDSHLISFRQLDGDLDHFDGRYQVTALEETLCETVLHVDFDIGIPLLADMLNPVACRSLRASSQRMLRQIESRVADSTPR